MPRKDTIMISRDEFYEMCGNHNLQSIHNLSNNEHLNAKENVKDLDAVDYNLKPTTDDDNSVAPTHTAAQDLIEIASGTSVSKKKRKKKKKKTKSEESVSANELAKTEANKEHLMNLSAGICQDIINPVEIIVQMESQPSDLFYTFWKGKQDVINYLIEMMTPELQFQKIIQDYYGSLNRTQHKQDKAGTSSIGFIDELNQLKEMFLDVIPNQNIIKNQLMELESNYHNQEKNTETNVKKLNELEEIVNQISSLKYLNKEDVKQLVIEQVAQLSEELKSSQDALKNQMKQLASNMKQNSNEVKQKCSCSMHLNNTEIKGHIKEQVARLHKEMKASQDGLKDQIKKLSSDMKQNSNEIKQSITSIKTKNMHANTLNTVVHLLRTLTEKVDSQGKILHCNGELSDSITENCVNNFPKIIDTLLKIQCDFEQGYMEQRKAYQNIDENRSLNNQMVALNSPQLYADWSLLSFVSQREYQQALFDRDECIRRLENDLALARRISDSSFLGKLVPSSCAKLVFNCLGHPATLLALVVMDLCHKWFF